jgi:thioredoxin
MIQITDSTFDTINPENKPMLIKFYTEWCGACKALKPIIDELSEQYADAEILIGEVNCTENPKLSERFEIRSIPATILFKDGVVVDKQLGSAPKRVFDAMLSKVLGDTTPAESDNDDNSDIRDDGDIRDNGKVVDDAEIIRDAVLAAQITRQIKECGLAYKVDHDDITAYMMLADDSWQTLSENDKRVFGEVGLTVYKIPLDGLDGTEVDFMYVMSWIIDHHRAENLRDFAAPQPLHTHNEHK